MNIDMKLDIDDMIWDDWGESFEQRIKEAVEDELTKAVQKAMRDKDIKARVTKFVMDKMTDKLDELKY